MRRFTILNLMALVFGVAVAFAALHGANEWWSGGLLLVTLALIGFSALAAQLDQGRSRAAWFGFLVMAGGYFLAIRTLPEQERSWLPTTRALEYAYGKITPSSNWLFQLKLGLSDAAGTQSPAGTNGSVPNFQPLTFIGTSGAIPLYATHEPFLNVGQNLFALLFGEIGAILARVMWARREAQTSPRDSV